MEIVKHPDSGAPIAVVGDALGQDGNQRRLACVYIAYDAYLDQFLWPLVFLHHV